MVKIAEDTMLLSLLSGPAQDHGPVLSKFVEWCDSSCFAQKVTKTKDILPSMEWEWEFMGNKWKLYTSIKYLGTVIDDKLRFEANTEVKIQRRQVFPEEAKLLWDKLEYPQHIVQLLR